MAKQYILIVEDEKSIRLLYKKTLENSGWKNVETTDSAEKALEILRKKTPALIISDIRLPGKTGLDLLKTVRAELPQIPFVLITAFPDIKNAVEALKIGAVDYLEKPIDLNELKTVVADILGTDHHEHEEIPAQALANVVFESAAMHSVFENAYRVAQSEATVLLTGESGTGKEVLAQFIHRNSPRRDEAMIAINCAAIPANLLGSELFGHEKGAFTGATAKRKGRFREAEGGTLFLDEIGDMPLELQASVLRALENRVVTPIGSDSEIKLDIRLIAATNRNLLQDIQNKKFREDLYYRLNVISLEIPPLRERKEDILPLAKHFFSLHDAEVKRLSPATVNILLSYDWPGNIRELANAMEHAILLSNTNVILPDHLPPMLRKHSPTVESNLDGSTVKTLQEGEQELIERALEQTNGNRTQAAKILGITRRGLLFKLKRLGID